MKPALIRVASFSASCGLLVGGLALPAEAAAAVAPTNVIAIPSPGQVTAACDAPICPWRLAHDAEIHSMSQAATSSYVLLVEALCAMLGS